MSLIQRSRAFLSAEGVLPAPPFGVAGRGAVVAASMAAASFVALGLSRWVAGGQFAAFLPAVTLVTLCWGPGSGLFGVAFAVVVCRFLFAPAFLRDDQTALLLFAILALVDVSAIAVLLRANARAQNLLASLRASESRFRGLLEAAPDAIVIADAAGQIVLLNAEAERLFGYERGDLLGRNIDLLMPERFRMRHAGRVTRFLANPAIKRMGDGADMFGLRKDGTEFPIETNLSPLASRGEVLVTSAIRDLSSRREIGERQALLVRELNHRVKNTLASVQSIIAQTLRASPNPEHFNAAFAARITALSQSHDVLTRNDWAGALVRDIILEQIGPYARPDAPFRLDGPPVTLGPNRAVTLGMVIGELATNAAKFGALSVAGSVSITWVVDEADGQRRLRLTWREQDGPAIPPPTRQGFGTRLIERSLAAGLQGVARLEFSPDGLVANLEFPLLEGEA